MYKLNYFKCKCSQTTFFCISLSRFTWPRLFLHFSGWTWNCDRCDTLVKTPKSRTFHRVSITNLKSTKWKQEVERFSRPISSGVSRWPHRSQEKEEPVILTFHLLLWVKWPELYLEIQIPLKYTFTSTTIFNWARGQLIYIYCTFSRFQVIFYCFFYYFVL